MKPKFQITDARLTDQKQFSEFFTAKTSSNLSCVTGFYNSSHSLPLFVLAEVFTGVFVCEGDIPGHSADHTDCQGHHH